MAALIAYLRLCQNSADACSLSGGSICVKTLGGSSGSSARFC